ncbi:zinc finger RNA-binding protein 2-like [Amphibalanus amphitrite]|uniref:zinc finger RNA-binding protein 2-like n=1 Tax=Amphibalanus amphitrite TaxID=1232801 RepID=UPI001C9105F7|nr:zinc finger RNA-binding protein 2-like [Amphibalanus amphitrite]
MAESAPFRCSLCAVTCNSEQSWQQHLAGIQHAKHTVHTSVGGRTEGAAAASEFFCAACQLQCSGPVPWSQHLQSGRHLVRCLQTGGLVRTGQQTARPAQQTAGPAQQTAQPVKQAAQPAQQTAQPVKQTAQPAQHTAGPVRPAQQTVDQVLETAAPTQQTALPTQQTGGPAPGAPAATSHLATASTQTNLPPPVIPILAQTAGSTPPSAPGLPAQPPGLGSGAAAVAASPFHCGPCGVQCSGAVSWQQHIDSSRHRKKAAGGRLD